MSYDIEIWGWIKREKIMEKFGGLKMTIKDAKAYDPWKAFSGPNLGYVIGQYDLFQTNPEEVDPELKKLF